MFDFTAASAVAISAFRAPVEMADGIEHLEAADLTSRKASIVRTVFEFGPQAPGLEGLL
jgi:hypothetical protein